MVESHAILKIPVTFRFNAGGLLVASGPGCNIRLHNVKFQYSTLVVLDGASVEVDGALFNCSLDRGTGVSMFVHGPGSTVMAKDIKMEGGLQGVSVVHGGFLWGLNMECHGVEVSGLEAQGKGSKLLLQRCSVAGMGRKYSNADATPNDEGKVETFCSGVVLRNESAGLFSEVSVIKAETGLCAEYNSLIDAHDCKMAECLASGANVSNTSTAMFNKCVMHGSLFFHGLSVDGAGTHVTATDCMFARNKQSGAGVYGGGFMELRDCESEGNESSGFWAQGSGNLVLIDCTSHRDTTGCGACGKGSELVARRVTVSRSTRNGMDIFDEGSAELTDCAISECEGCGLLVIAEGKVHAEGCAFEHALTHHGIVVAGEKSTASANNCSLSRNKQSGAGVYDGGRLHLSHCTSEYNQHSGYWVQAGGQMTLSECESDHDRIGFGASGRHSMLLAMNSVVKRSTERGVQVFNQAASELVNCSILDSNFSGLVVVDGARVVAKGCTIKDARVRHGVEVSGEGSSAEATECYLMGNSEAGAGVFQSGRLTLNKCKAGGNGVAGYWTQSTGHLILNDCTSSGDSIGCGARGEGTQLRMAGGRVMCCSKNGILVDDGANGAVFGVHASLNDDSSFACSGPGTSMHVKCCASLDATPYSVRDGARMVCMDSVPPFESAFVPPEARLSSWPPIALVGHAINIA